MYFLFALLIVAGFSFFGQTDKALAVGDAFSVLPVTSGTDNLFGASSTWYFNTTSSAALSRNDVVQFVAPTVTMGQSFNLANVFANSFTGNVDLYRSLGASLSNILTNPSFESSTSSWDGSNMGGTSYVYPTSTVSNSGSGAVQIDVDAGGNLAMNQQNSLSVVTGNSYSLSFYARGQVGGETARVILSSGAGVGCGLDLYAFNFITQTWGCAALPASLAPGSAFVFDSALTNTFARFSTTTIIATSSMQLILVGGGDPSFASQTIIFDDVQLEAGGLTAYNAGGTGVDTQGVAANQAAGVIYGFVSSTVPMNSVFTADIGGIVNAMRPLQDLSPLNWQLKIGTPADPAQPWGSLSATKVTVGGATVSLARAGHPIVSDANSSITPSSYSTSATNVDYTFVFTTSSTIPIGGKIALNFPTDFNISGATVTGANNANINASGSPARVADNAITTSTTNGLNRILLTISNAVVAAGETVTVKVGGITNPSSANAYRGFFVYTAKDNGGLLDGSPTGISDESGYGSMPPVDTVHIGGTNKLHVVVQKKLANGTIQNLSALERAQVLVGVGCQDKGFFVGNRWLNSLGQADYNNLLDCNYTIGTPPVNTSDPTFFDNFIRPSFATVQAVGGIEATTTIYYGVPDATVTFRVTGGVTGQNAFISAHSSEFESQSPLFADPALTTPGFSATGTGYASIKVRSGQSWSFEAEGGSFGGQGGNFSNGGGSKYWPPSIPSLFVTAATSYDLGSVAYVEADKTLTVSLLGAGGSTPVTNACVGVKRSGGGVFMGAQDTICSPNSGSDYQFKVPLGAITIQVMRQGFGVPLEFPVAITGNTTSKTIYVSVPTTYIKAIVVDSNSLPINGAPIFVNGPNGFGQGMTDSSGSSTIYIAPGTYTVGGFAPGFGPLTTQSVVLSTNQTVTFTIASGDFKTITGTVTQDGSPLGGIKIGARGILGTNGGNGTETLANGTYTLRVPAGQYEVGGWSQDTGGLAPQNVDVRSTNQSNINWALNGQGTLHLIIQNSSNVSPLFGGAFDPTTGRGNGTDSWTTSGLNKTADIKLPAGTYSLHVGSPMIGEIANDTVTISSGLTATKQYDISTSSTIVTMSGSVTSTAGGAGVANVAVWASRLDGPGFFSTLTDANGAYSLNVPDAHNYKVGAKILGYVAVQGDVTVSVSGNKVQNFTVTPSAYHIAGTVRNSNGAVPVANAWVSAKQTIDGTDTWLGVPTDANGAYSLDVVNGNWTVYAEGPCLYKSAGVAIVVNNAHGAGGDISLNPNNSCSAPTPEVHGITASSGGQVSKSNLILDIPANALGSANSTVSVQVASASLVVSTSNATPLANSVQSITATDSTGQSITSLSNNVNLTITYNVADLPNGFDQSTLQLGYFDTTSGQWEPVAATVDTVNHTLTASVSHFTDYGPILPGVPTAPTGLAATAVSASEIDLTWTAVPAATSYTIYRSLDNVTFTTQIATGVSSASYHNTTGLSASTQYYYKVAGVNASGEGVQSSSANATTQAAAQQQVSGGSAGGGSGVDTFPPSNTSISINSGATSTLSTTVTLTLGASSDATQMMLTNDSTSTVGVWENFVTTKTWQITNTTGTKVIYAKFKDAAGNISSPVFATISLLTAASTTLPAPVIITPAPVSIVETPEAQPQTIEIIFTNPSSYIEFSKINSLSLQPGTNLTFKYQYKNNTDKKVTVKVVRQLLNSKGKTILTTSVNKTLKAGAEFTNDVKQLVNKTWLPGQYTVKIKVLNNKNVVIDENGLNFQVEKLKHKYFSLGTIANENSSIVFTPSILNKVKSNGLLPVILRLKYEYTNQIDKKQTVRMIRKLISSTGKTISTNTGKWTMNVGEKDSTNFTQPVAANLAVGDYYIKIIAQDWTTKEELAINSIGFKVELK